MPYVADGVPGWFQAVLRLRDANGKELAYNDDFRFNPDPLIYFEVPEDGEYVLTINEALFRGRESFVYRITIGELPFVTSIFPLGGRVGEPVKIEMDGWNLEKTTLAPPPKDAKPGQYLLAATDGKFVSNYVPFALDTLPECLEQEPNDTPAQAQKVTLPIIINGRVGSPGRLGRLRGGRKSRRDDRRGSVRPPPRLPAGFLPQGHRRGRQDHRAERRSFRRGVGHEHRPRRFLPHGEAARRRKVLRPPRRHAAAGRERSMPTGSGSASRSPISCCA